MIDRLARIVTNHHRAVLLVMLIVTAGVFFGISQIELQEEADMDELATETEVGQAAEYLEEHYDATLTGDERDTAVVSVYVQDDENVLDRSVLLEAIEYQLEVTENPTVAAALTGAEIQGPPNLVATTLADDPHLDLEAQHSVLSEATDEEVSTAVSAVFADGDRSNVFLPTSFEPGTADATSMRIMFEVTADGTAAEGQPIASTAVQEAIDDLAGDRTDPAFFTLTEPAQESWMTQQMQDTFWLILPVALALVLSILAFAYRDLADVVIGFIGVLLSVGWMFGLLGWLGIPAGMTMIIGPVLIVALSIDFGLHVFMRYREQRGPSDGIKASMRRAAASVTVAFLLVTVTAAIGFLANLTNPMGVIQELGIGITLGVVSAFIVFSTIVPALKIAVDGGLERLGRDRRRTPLGHGRVLRPILSAGVDAARVAAPIIIVLALILGAAGGAMYTNIDTQGFQNDYEVADWQADLPGPMAWEAHETDYRQNLEFVQSAFQADSEAERTTRVLIRGDVTDPTALERVAAGTEVAPDTPYVFDQGGIAAIESPLSVMDRVAQEHDGFAATLDAADTTGDGVPDRDIEAVYDALFEAAPTEAAQVIERTPEGKYASLVMAMSAGMRWWDRARYAISAIGESAARRAMVSRPMGDTR